MIARTTAVIEAGAVLGAVACAPPLTLRQVHGEAGPGRCELRLVGTAAGPLAGDDLSLRLELRAGARATLRAAGASLAQGLDHGRAAALSIRADLAERADLIADPGALILCRDSLRADLRPGPRAPDRGGLAGGRRPAGRRAHPAGHRAR